MALAKNKKKSNNKTKLSIKNIKLNKKLLKNKKIEAIMKKLKKVSKNKLLEWKKPTMKGSSQGLSINGTMYKSIKELKAPSLKVCDEALAAQDKFKDCADTYEKTVDANKKKLEALENSKEVLKTYYNEVELKVPEVKKEFFYNNAVMWIKQKEHLLKLWKDFEKRKEESNSESSKPEKKENKGRYRSIGFFEEACENPKKILDSVQELASHPKNDCAVLESIKVMTVSAEGFKKQLELTEKRFTESMAKLEAFTEKLILEAKNNNQNNDEEEGTDKPKNNITPKKSNNKTPNKNSKFSQKDIMSELQDRLKNKKKN